MSSPETLLGKQRAQQKGIVENIKSRLPAMTATPVHSPEVPLQSFSPPPTQRPHIPSLPVQNTEAGGSLPGISGAPMPVSSPNQPSTERFSRAPPPMAYTANSDMKNLISQTASFYGIDPALALSIARQESQFDPKARAKGSSAGGLFQFIDSTWDQYGKGKDKYDAAANTDAAMRFIRDNQTKLVRNGIDPTPEATYLSHFLGTGGAIKVLKNLNDPVDRYLTSQAVKTNNLKGKTGNDMVEWAAQKMGSGAWSSAAF